MTARRIGVLFEERAWPVRLAVLLVLAVGYLLLVRAPAGGVSEMDWAVSAGSLLVAAGTARWPLAGAVAQAGLLAVALQVGHPSAVIVKVGAGVALFELSTRRSGRQVLAGALPVLLVFSVEAGGGLGSALYRGAVVTLLPVLLGGYIRSVRLLGEQAERRAREELLRRDSELRAVRADERTAIARELHDLVAHHVASVVLRVAVARHVLRTDDPAVHAVLDDVHASGVATLADLRRLVAALRDPAGGGGIDLVDPAELPTALAGVVDRARRLGLTVEARIDPRVAGLDAVRGLALLRLVQEGLSNVARHAGPGATATLSITVSPTGAAMFEVVDDGGGTGGPVPDAGGPVPGTSGSAGFGGAARPVLGAGHDGGYGIVGMRERVAVLGGSMTAGRDGAGWRLVATLPPTGTARPDGDQASGTDGDQANGADGDQAGRADGDQANGADGDQAGGEIAAAGAASTAGTTGVRP